jgi:hypothetical protein
MKRQLRTLAENKVSRLALKRAGGRDGKER